MQENPIVNRLKELAARGWNSYGLTACPSPRTQTPLWPSTQLPPPLMYRCWIRHFLLHCPLKQRRGVYNGQYCMATL